jgi:circadian clock protein KaiC
VSTPRPVPHGVKYRGRTFRGGNHDYVIRHGGLEVYPRLVASEHRGHPDRTRMPTGVEALDALMGGGIERSTSTLIVGAPGTGKSSLAAQFAACTAHRGEGAAMFIFDESTETLLVTIDTPTHATLADGDAVLTITDDD